MYRYTLLEITFNPKMNDLSKTIPKFLEEKIILKFLFF